MVSARSRALTNASGSGIGVSGPATASAEPRPLPTARLLDGAPDGPTPQELRAAWLAYTGQFGPTDGPLSRQSGTPDLNVLSNRIKPIVNIGVDFLFGPTLALRVTDAEADESAGAPGVTTAVGVSGVADQAQRLLDATLGDEDQRMTFFSKAGVNGGVYGHVFVKVVEPRRGNASVANPPRLILLNPEIVSVFCDPEDADLVTRYRIEYATNDPTTGVPIRRRQDISRIDPDDDDSSTADGMDSDTTWLIQNYTATGMTGGRFLADGPAVVWPYELPPIVDWQNYPNPNAHWGQRDVTDSLVALNAQLRLVESNINKVGFLQGHPILYSVGADTGGMKPVPGAVFDLGAVDADIKAVNAAGDLAQLMAFAEQLRSDMDEESGIPGVATGRMETLPRGQVSGITMRLLYAPALSRTEHKRRLYGQGIRQMCQTILCLCGMDYATVQRLDIQLGWQDPLPDDDLALAQALVALQGIGYSQHTLIERSNGDPDVEAQWKAEESAAQMSAVTRGAALPPAPGLAPDPSAPASATPPDEEEAQPAPPQRQGRQSAPPTNHPAAVAARNRMRAAFGKGPQPS